MTKAELKRRLGPGTKLRLVENRNGPCDEPREVKIVRAAEIVMMTPLGTFSSLELGKGFEVAETPDGFQVTHFNRVGLTRYSWA